MGRWTVVSEPLNLSDGGEILFVYFDIPSQQQEFTEELRFPSVAGKRPGCRGPSCALSPAALGPPSSPQRFSFLLFHWQSNPPSSLVSFLGVSLVAQWKQMWLVSMRTQAWSLASLSGLRIHIALSCGVGHRCGSDPILLWLWRRPVATAPIQPQPGNLHVLQVRP